MLKDDESNNPFAATFTQKTAVKPKASYRRLPDWTISFFLMAKVYYK
jgi:hypothetical protein